MANTPEELEQMRAFGQALIGQSIAPNQALTSNRPYAFASPLSPVLAALQGAAGWGNVSQANQGAANIRRERSASIPGVGTADNPPRVSPLRPTRTGTDPNSMVTGSVDPSINPSVNQSTTPFSFAGEMGRYANAIKAIESSGGNYSLIGRRHPKLGRPLGAYQVMEGNLQTWLREAGLPPMTSDQFVANREAQDRVFNHRFGLYVQRYGNPVDAAQAWFAGPGTIGGNIDRMRPDALGTTVRRYRDSFANHLARQGPTVNQGAAAPVASAETPRMNLGMGPGTEPEGETSMVSPVAETGTPSGGGPNQLEAELVQSAQGGADRLPPGSTPPNFVGGIPPDLPPGVPNRIPPSPQLQAIVNQLRNPALLTNKEFNDMLEQYQKLSQPQAVQTAFGTATYHPGTGELMNFVPSMQNRQVTYPGGSTTLPQIWSGGQLSTVPQGPMGAPGGGAPGGGAPGGIQNPNVSPGAPPFPQTGRVEDMSSWGQRQEALGTIATRLAEGQAARITSAETQGVQASERIKMLNAVRTATQAVAKNRVSGEALSRLQTVLGQYARNFGPIPTGPMNDVQYREFLDKLNAFLASEATQEISARGTNFEFATLLRYNPNLFATHEGTMMLIDYMIQEKRAQQAIGNMAARLKPEQVGEFNERVDRYYAANPIYINIPASGNRPAMRITTRHIPQVGELKPDMSGAYTEAEVREALQSLPRGVWFINPRTGEPTPTVPPTSQRPQPATRPTTRPTENPPPVQIPGAP